MNREIKFRAWDKRKSFMIKIFDSTTQSSWFLPEVSKNFEIMQFTGIKDKDGKDIYEGDICMLTDAGGFEVLSVVKFFDGCFNVVFQEPLRVVRHQEKTHNYVKWDPLKYFTCNHAAKVIGNIWENPELMEGDA